MKESQQYNVPLAILANALSRLQNGSGIDSEDLWFGKTAEELSKVTEDSGVEQTATTVIDALSQLRRATKLLDALSLSSKSFMNILRQKSKHIRLQYGIMTLPDEILAQIFECVQDSYSHSEPDGKKKERREMHMLYVSSVCRRWRRVALSTPTLWSTLDINMSQDTISSYLKRSRTVELCIILKWPSPCDAFTFKFQHYLLREIRRWKELIIEFACRMPFAWEAVDKWLGGIFRPKELELPALRSLTIRAIGPLSSDSVTSDNVENFVFRWKMPRLRSLDLYSVIPSRMHNYGDKITSLTFNFSDMNVKLRYFFSFLDTLPKLEDFTLVGVLPTTLLTESYERRASFPDLNSLALKRCDNATLKFVLTSFDIPKVSKLVLDMDLTSYASAKDLPFLNILYDHTSFISRIKSLSLSLDRSRSEVHPHATLDHLFANFTSLEHFSLSSNPTCPYVATRKKLERMMFYTLKNTPLKTIKIRDCTDLTVCFPRLMHYLLRGNKSEEEESEFQRLEIIGRSNFIDADFKSIPKEKVVWIPDGEAASDS